MTTIDPSLQRLLREYVESENARNGSRDKQLQTITDGVMAVSHKLDVHIAGYTEWRKRVNAALASQDEWDANTNQHVIDELLKTRTERAADSIAARKESRATRAKVAMWAMGIVSLLVTNAIAYYVAQPSPAPNTVQSTSQQP